MLMGTPNVSLGNPIIKYDSTGNVIEWTATQPIILDGKTYIDTGFKVYPDIYFDWELSMTFVPTNSNNIVSCGSNFMIHGGLSRTIVESGTSKGYFNGNSMTIQKTYERFYCKGDQFGIIKSEASVIIGFANDTYFKGVITKFSVKKKELSVYTKTEVLGKPKITKNAKDVILKYEITEPVTLSNQGFNTDFRPFEHDFKLHMKVTPNSGNANYATLIHALYEDNSGNYRGFIIRKRGVSSVTRWWRLIIGSDEHNLNSYMTDGKTVTIDIVKKNQNLTINIDNTEVNTSSDYIEDLTSIWIGSDSGGNNVVKATIEELTIEKI